MKNVATIRLKAKQSKYLLDMSSTFTKAVQFAIDRGFEDKISNRFSLHHLVYKNIRQWLPADFAIEAIGKAAENLKSTKLKIRPIMKKPTISFNRKLFTFAPTNIRMASFKPRQRVDVPISIPQYYSRYLSWKYQTLEIMKDRKGRLFFHITFSREADASISCSNITVGVDLGVNNLAVCSDSKVFKTPKTKIKQFRFLRSKLQAKGTKSATRLLKKLSGRQKRYMAWVNHNVSRSIVGDADTIVLENLKGIRKGRNRFIGKRLNRWLNNWSFFQLQSFIKYKAERDGKRVVFVNPYMTSQICSSCSQLGNRYFDSFFCPHCGFSSQSDFNASCNLRRLSVTQPNVPVDDAKGQLTTAADIRDNQHKSVKPHALAWG